VNVDCCRVCRGTDLRLVLDLGKTALANRFIAPDRATEPEPTYPLRVVLCENCGLVQLDEEVPPEDLFRHYLYVSGTSDLIHSHAAFLARHFARLCPLAADDLVVEVASNDGTVLKAFRTHGVRTVGIEPAVNIAEQANRDGIETICEFFNRATAEQVRRRVGPARFVLARHVLAHVNDLHGFVHGLRLVLADDGLASVEFPHLLPFYRNLEYDTVYHEHLCYFSVKVIRNLFERFGLELVDVTEVNLHGGSVLVSAQPFGGPRRPTAGLAEVLRQEEEAGLDRLEPWRQFGARVAHGKALLLDEIDRLLSGGKRLAGYGAPAKGMTLLAYCGIGPDRLSYLVDRSPHKQGLLTPGHHIPVLSPEVLLRDQPDVVLMLAWNFAAEVVRQQAEYLRRGGRFLLPIPKAHYWNDSPGEAGRNIRAAA
jgi:novobiocin biosynthesis protein NovU/D-mycarose 3-C-methyltransferase